MPRPPFIDSESTGVSVRTLRRNPPHHKANETADRLNLALSGGAEHVFHNQLNSAKERENNGA